LEFLTQIMCLREIFDFGLGPYTNSKFVCELALNPEILVPKS